MTWRARPQRAQVHVEDGDEQRRADRAVRGGEHAAHGRREPVHRAQAGVGEAEASEQAGEGEVLPCGRVGPLQAGAAKRARGALASGAGVTAAIIRRAAAPLMARGGWTIFSMRSTAGRVAGAAGRDRPRGDEQFEAPELLRLVTAFERDLAFPDSE